MSNFVVDWSSSLVPGKSQIIIRRNEVNNTSTSLSLTGKGVINYGEIQQENFIRLLENFASSTAPSNPTVGQLWYSYSDRQLKVWQGSTWNICGGSYSSSTAPETPQAGAIWLDTNEDPPNVKIWTGAEWKNLVTRIGVSGGSTGLTTSESPVGAVKSSGTILLDGILNLQHGGTGAATAEGARQNLQIGNLALQDFANVYITGGNIRGINDLAVEDGGTSASTVEGARANLDVPSRTGENASGTWNISISGTAENANAVSWDGITLKPSYFPSDWFSISNKPEYFKSRWLEIDDKPSIYPTDWQSISQNPFIYAGQAGTPSWLWGTNDGVNYRVWNPKDMEVKYADYAGAVIWDNIQNKPTTQSAGITYFPVFSGTVDFVNANTSGEPPSAPAYSVVQNFKGRDYFFDITFKTGVGANPSGNITANRREYLHPHSFVVTTEIDKWSFLYAAGSDELGGEPFMLTGFNIPTISFKIFPRASQQKTQLVVRCPLPANSLFFPCRLTLNIFTAETNYIDYITYQSSALIP